MKHESLVSVNVHLWENNREKKKTFSAERMTPFLYLKKIEDLKIH